MAMSGPGLTEASGSPSAAPALARRSDARVVAGESPAAARAPARRWLPPWLRFVLALWAVVVLLLAFQHATLWLFIATHG
jgi:type VI protein secretion system component VasF